MTRLNGMLYALSLTGSTFTWYCFTNPPMEATWLTPGTLSRPSFNV